MLLAPLVQLLPNRLSSMNCPHAITIDKMVLKMEDPTVKQKCFDIMFTYHSMKDFISLTIRLSIIALAINLPKNLNFDLTRDICICFEF